VAYFGVVESSPRSPQRQQLTAQALTDIGRGATFYDCLSTFGGRRPGIRIGQSPDWPAPR